MISGELVKLLRQCWPWAGARASVLEGYAVLGRQHQQTLADICLRNHVFSDAPVAPNDAIGLAIAEGRRRAALEILTLARADALRIHALQETKPPTERGVR